MTHHSHIALKIAIVFVFFSSIWIHAFYQVIVFYLVRSYTLLSISIFTECINVIALLVFLFFLVHRALVKYAKTEFLLQNQNDELIKTKNELQTIFNAVPALIFYKNMSNDYIHFNKCTAVFFGLPIERTESLSNSEIFPEDIVKKHWEEDLGIFASGQGKLNIVETVTTPTGTKIWNYSKIPYRDNQGDLIGVICFALDITECKLMEETLEDQNTFLQTLIDTIPSPVFYKDTDCVYLGCNKAFAKEIDLNNVDIVGKTSFDIAPVKLADKYHEMDMVLLHQPGVQTYEMAVIYADGIEHTVEFNKSTFIKKDGTVGGLVGVILDITEYKKNEEQLRKSRDFYLTLLETFPALIWRSGIDAQCDYFNRAWLAFTGRRLEQEIGNGWTEVVHHEDSQLCFSTYMEAFDNRQPFSLEFRVRRHDGEYRWIIDYGSPFNDLSGNFAGYIGSCYDITDRKIEERDTRRTSKILSDAQRIAHLGNWRCDIATKEMNLSEEACRIFGLDPHTSVVTYESILEVVHPDDLAMFAAAIDKSLKNVPYSLEHRIVRPDGEMCYIHGQGEVTFDGIGTPVFACGTVLDITNRKKVEKELICYQEQLKNMAEEMSLAEERERCRIATGLHDQVGQNLIFIKMKLGELVKTPLTSEQKESIQKIITSIGMVIQEIRILTSQIYSPLLYQIGIAAAIELLCEQFEEKHEIMFEFRDDKEPKELNEEIKVALFQIVRELLVNVAKHSAAQRVKIAVERVDMRIKISVTDDGIGFDTALLTKPRSGHGGFGLFNISQRIEHLGGAVNISSTIGSGTQVTLMSPLLH